MDTQSTGIPHRDLIRSILRRFNTPMLNWSHETGRTLRRLVAVRCDQYTAWLRVKFRTSMKPAPLVSKRRIVCYKKEIKPKIKT